MCKNCVKELFPDRQRSCHETAIFFSNLKTGSCSCCGKFDFLKNETKIERTEEETEEGVYEESITFNHACVHCKHIVAEHSYSFVVDGNKQMYNMLCLLCGKGQDESFLTKVNVRKENNNNKEEVSKMEAEKNANDLMKGFSTSIKLINSKKEDEDDGGW